MPHPEEPDLAFAKALADSVHPDARKAMDQEFTKARIARITKLEAEIDKARKLTTLLVRSAGGVEGIQWVDVLAREIQSILVEATK